MNTSSFEPADRIHAEFQIKDAVARAARLIDSRQFEAFSELFTADGVLHRPGAAPLVGRSAITAAYASRPPGRLTRHIVTNTVVTWVSEQRATAESYVLLWSGEESAEVTAFGRQAHGRQVVGEFTDTFSQVDGRWLLAERYAQFVLFAGA